MPPQNEEPLLDAEQGEHSQAQLQQHVGSARLRCPSSKALMAAGFGLGALCTLLVTLLATGGGQQG